VSSFRRLPAAAAVLAAAAALAAPAAAHADGKKSFYVSLGDSYAQGVQPLGPGGTGQPTDEGYTDYLYERLRDRRKNAGLRLVKLGCGGATTDSMINGTKPCGENLPYESDSKRTSQLTHAARWMRAKRRRGHRIAYVTLSIGGNDYAACAREPDLAAILACTVGGIEEMKANLPVIARRLRRAAGRHAVIAANTYPDVILGEWVRGGQDLAELSVGVFKDAINPPMRRIYRKRRIGFVDATRHFGGYVPFETTVETDLYGEIPKSVERICTLGWYCENRDIHLRSAGYAKLARLYARKIRRLERQR
jgi:lysophospholipase L1-like esterase